MPDNNPFKKYSPSIKKRWRTTAKRTARLKPFRSRAATALRDAKIAIEDGDENAEIQVRLKAAHSAIDRAARRNIIHKNTAARRKSRLAKLAKANQSGSGDA